MQGLLTVLLVLGPIAALPCWAQAADSEESPRYVLGLSASAAPEYDGATRRELKLRPVLAFRLGRVRIASAGGSSLLGFGRQVAGAGASTELLAGEDWQVGAALRLDNGRDSADADATRGLPDVKRTLRVRIYANYSLTKDWQLDGWWSQDALGRGGGWLAGADVGWRFHRSADAEWSASLAVTAASALNMRSHFGVPVSAVERSGLPAYVPGMGVRDASLSVGVKRALGPHWLVFGSVGVRRLLGPAADSPWVQQPGSHQVNLGVAWRR